jgi:hypothetical protein
MEESTSDKVRKIMETTLRTLIDTQPKAFTETLQKIEAHFMEKIGEDAGAYSPCVKQQAETIRKGIEKLWRKNSKVPCIHFLVCLEEAAKVDFDEDCVNFCRGEFTATMNQEMNQFFDRFHENLEK